MGRKKKFDPQITRIVLNPEQAVLLGCCYDPSVPGGFEDTYLWVVPRCGNVPTGDPTGPGNCGVGPEGELST